MLAETQRQGHCNGRHAMLPQPRMLQRHKRAAEGNAAPGAAAPRAFFQSITLGQPPG